jgi:kynurenine formamidase
MAEKGTNWGRWGQDDQRGTLNLLTPDHVQRAASLVRTGRVYSLGMTLEKNGPNHVTRNPLWHLTSKTDRAVPAMSSADDIIVMHTHTGTHVDALCHIYYEGHLYNGYSSDEITRQGAPRNGVHNIGSLVTRGVLLDVAGFRGVEHLQCGEVIMPDELDACARQQGVEVRPADAVLIRTGWRRVFERDRALYDSGSPGPGRAVAAWFRDHDLVALGADNVAVEVQPPEDGVQMALHIEVIRNQGGYLIEFLDLEELARDRVYEFMFTLAPLRLLHGIGSPVNPLALA